jgi:hypothetical protein
MTIQIILDPGPSLEDQPGVRHVLPFDLFQLSQWKAAEKARISHFHSLSELQSLTMFTWHLASNNNIISVMEFSTVVDPIKDLFGAQDGIPWDSPVWKNYMEEAKHQDENVIRNWNQSMDVILIFVCC